jgi:hypothetical protein
MYCTFRYEIAPGSQANWPAADLRCGPGARSRVGSLLAQRLRRRLASGFDERLEIGSESAALCQLKTVARLALSKPALLVSMKRGKNSAVATPIWALVVTRYCSASATSGRRIKSWAGKPGGNAGGVLSCSGLAAPANEGAGWPQRIATACPQARCAGRIAAAVGVLEGDQHRAEGRGIGRRVLEAGDPDLPGAVPGHQDLLEPAPDTEGDTTAAVLHVPQREEAGRRGLRVNRLATLQSIPCGASLPRAPVKQLSFPWYSLAMSAEQSGLSARALSSQADRQ